MDAYGQISREVALDKHGRVVGKGIEYMRSRPLNSIHVDVPPKDIITLVTEVEMNSGFLTFRQDLEDQVIKTTRNFSCVFKGHTLEKVDNQHDGGLFASDENFYPILYKMLNTKQDWSSRLCFRGCATLEIGVMEWTELILANFESVLNQAGIFGAVGVSQYPYHYCMSVWKAFLELWSPLTNTLHHGDGELSISLWDMKMIGGLPISGIPYEEFIPENKRLQRDKSYPATLSELLCIHSRLCVLSKQNFVRWGDWVRHFYRGQLLYTAYGEDTQCINHTQREKFMGFRPTLAVSREGELAAFLAYWLSRFVFPSYYYIIRPETFHMACLMAQGIRVSLAPAVLGHTYHGLGKIVTDPRGPGGSRSCFPVHYVIGWLGEHFNCLYRRHADSEFPENYPHLKRYAGIKAQDFDVTRARLVFRTRGSVEYRPSPFIEPKGHFLIDDGNLSEEKFDLLVCLRSALLPIRIGGELWLEPYYPNRFARQFGFDQGVPANRLQFKIEKRNKCGVEDLAKAQIKLLRADTGTRFYIPRSSYDGMCTWTYCRWWMMACAPYLGRSVSFVYLTLKKRPLERQNNIFPLKSLKDASAAKSRKILFSDFEEGDPATYSRSDSPFEGREGGMSKKAHRTNPDDENWGSKRARYNDLRGNVTDETASLPADHASHNGDKVIALRLKSVVVSDLILKSQSLKPSLEDSETNLKERGSRLKQVESECKDSGRKSHVFETKREKPLPKEHSARPSSKEVNQNLSKSISQENALGFPLNTSEPLIKDLESELPSPESESLESVCEKTQYDVELPLIGQETATNSFEPKLLQLEWKQPTQLKGSELQTEGFSTPPRDYSDSNSGGTEPIDPDACETADEGICQLNETSSILRKIFNSKSNERWGDFIITEVEDILSKLSSSPSLKLITDCRGEVQKSLEMLGPVIKLYGSGEDRFERFAESVSKTFELADMLSKNMHVIEECCEVDTERIRNLIRSYEECHHAQAALDLELTGLNQEFEVLRASEEHIIKAEQKAQQLRQKYEIAKSHLEEKIASLKNSAEQQNKLAEELRQARIEAKEDQLVEFESLKNSHKAQEEEFERLVNSLKSFGEVSKQE